MKSKIATKQIEQAVAALFKNKKKESDNDLLGSDSGYINLDVITDKILKTKSLNPKVFALEHTPYMEDVEVCLIVKNEEDNIKEKLKAKGVTIVKEVVTILELKTKYKAYEARRKLATSYNVFLCDDRVTHILPNIIGKVFIANGKTPIGVKIARGNIKNAVDKVMKAATFAPNEGTINTVKVGNFHMSQKDVVANVEKIIPDFVTEAATNWNNVLQIGLKAKGTPLLAIYASLSQREPEEKEPKAGKKSTKKGAKKTESAEEKVPAVKEEVTEKKAPATKKTSAAAAEKKAPATKKAAAATEKKVKAEPTEKKVKAEPTEKKVKAEPIEKKAPATKKANAGKKAGAAKKVPAVPEIRSVGQKRKAAEPPADEKKPKTRAAAKAKTPKKSTK